MTLKRHFDPLQQLVVKFCFLHPSLFNLWEILTAAYHKKKLSIQLEKLLYWYIASGTNSVTLS